MHQLSFKLHRFPPDIIRHSIWLYARFILSFHDVEEMLAERGLDVSYETIRRWFLKFGSAITANLRRPARGPAINGTSTRWRSSYSGSVIDSGAPWTMKARFWTSSSSASETPKPLVS